MIPEIINQGLTPQALTRTEITEWFSRPLFGLPSYAEGLAQTLQHVLIDQPWLDAEQMARAAGKIGSDLNPLTTWKTLEAVCDQIHGSSC